MNASACYSVFKQDVFDALLTELKGNLVFPSRKALTDNIKARLDNLTKPQGSLGRLEELALQYCLCRQSEDARLVNKLIYVFAADHGITEEGTSLYPSDVTYQMVLNMLSGGAAISVLCRNAGIECKIVDIGVKEEIEGPPEVMKKLIHKKICKGTKNFLKAAAMSPDECWSALQVGIELASESKADLLGIGEMGIGNTSAASALFTLLLHMDVTDTVGAGTGLDREQIIHKQRIIGQAVQHHYRDWDKTPFDALRRVGGAEIAGMTGLIIGAANRHIPVVIDGFIASSAALIALQMEPAVTDYLFFAHQSAEKFHSSFLSSINKRPLLDLGMRLGEGTGSALAMTLIQQAMNCYHEMATFKSAGVAQACIKS